MWDTVLEAGVRGGSLLQSAIECAQALVACSPDTDIC